MKKIIFAIAATVIITSCSISQTPIANTIEEPIETEVEAGIGTEEEGEAPAEEEIDLKTQILGEWEFHEITLRTPKDGYLIHIAEQETKLIELSIVNYTFNTDGSVTFPVKYVESLGIKEGKWIITESGELAITYYFNDDSEFNAGNTNKSETFTYKVSISDEELTIDMQGIFITNLKRK